MRNGIVLAAVLFILAGTLVEAAEPIGWWKLDETKGETAKDSSGNGFDATEPMPKVTNFIIGGRNYPNADWYGKIDDFRIYNSALSQEDAKKLFENKGKSAK